MKRRQFLLGATSFVSLSALAQNKDASESGPAPFREISPGLATERNKVHAVIAFTCPVCAHYHGMLSGWGGSLPKQFSFDFLPAVTDKDSTTTAMAWLALKKVAPEKLPILASSLYRAIQDKAMIVSASDGSFWKYVLRDIGPTQGFVQAFRSIRPEDVSAMAAQLRSYQVMATPSVVVCGKYIVTPDNANGDESLFMQLASGMVSKMM